MAFGDESPEAILNRYHTLDYKLMNDGRVWGREKLIAHARPIRKNAAKNDAASASLEIHDALVDGARMAAHYTMTAGLHLSQTIVVEIFMFGELDADGYIRSIQQLTRTLPQPAGHDS